MFCFKSFPSDLIMLNMVDSAVHCSLNKDLDVTSWSML
jgi:hypothetical protein